MKQVNFYLLGSRVSHAKYKLAGRLAKKMQALNHSLLIVVDDQQEAQLLDQTLWTFSDTSFVAHDRIPAATEPASNTHIATVADTSQEVLAGNYDVLLTLSEKVPVFSHHFTRIAEIVESDDDAKRAARTRFNTIKPKALS